MRRLAIAGTLSVIGSLSPGLYAQGLPQPATGHQGAPQVQPLPPTFAMSDQRAAAPPTLTAPTAVSPAGGATQDRAVVGRFATPLINSPSSSGCGGGCSCNHCPPSNQFGTPSTWNHSPSNSAPGRTAGPANPWQTGGPMPTSTYPSTDGMTATGLPVSGQLGISRTPAASPVPETRIPSGIPQQSGYPQPLSYSPGGYPGRADTQAGAPGGAMPAGGYGQPYGSASPYGAQQASYQAPKYTPSPVSRESTGTSVTSLPSEKPSWWRRMVLRQKTVSPPGEDYYATATVTSPYRPASNPAAAPIRSSANSASTSEKTEAAPVAKRRNGWWPFGKKEG